MTDPVTPRHPGFTRRVRLVMRWNRLVYDLGLPRLGWDLTVREQGHVFKRSERHR